MYLWFKKKKKNPRFTILAYRDKGTGEPCARHKRPIAFLIFLSIQLRFTSDDSEGALTPTGSTGNYMELFPLKETTIKINIFQTWMLE